MEIVIRHKTPSINHLYFNWQNRRILTKEGRKLKELIIEEVKAQTTYFVTAIKPLCVKVDIHEDWYYKNGEIARKDISNREKFLIDCVFDALGIDDRLIFEHHMTKVQDKEEFSVISIEDVRHDKL